MLKAESRIYKNTKGRTLHLSIPSKLAADSLFPFKVGEWVTLDVDPKKKELVVRKK